jgi:hypothetical protein
MFKCTRNGVIAEEPIELSEKDREDLMEMIMVSSNLPLLSKSNGVWRTPSPMQGYQLCENRYE